jgi:predicted RNA-binding protein with PUA-like domain
LADLFCEVRVTKGPHVRGGKHVLEVEPIRRLDPPVPLRALRACPELAGLEFLHNSRVSISRVSVTE